MIYDVVIIGGGIVGLSSAMQLKKENPALKVALIEKEDTHSKHQTGHNSGVIHSGIYYAPGSSKAVNCKKGYKKLLDFCDEYHIEYDLCGKVIVATDEKQKSLLKNIYNRGLQNGLTNLKLLSKEETLEIEPYVKAVQSIHVPQAGIIDYKKVTKKYLELFEAYGGVSFFNNEVKNIKQEKHGIVIVETSNEIIETKIVVSCAGLFADRMAKMTNQRTDFKIIPFRGEYYNLKKEEQYKVKGLIYPVPNPDFPFLGVHYTKMINGGIEAGPNAVLAFKREGYSRWDLNISELMETVTYSGFRKLATKYWITGMGEMYRSYSKSAFVKALQHLIPSIGYNDLERGNAGVRAQAIAPDGSLLDDFLILESKGVINVCNAPSPAATSSLAIGEMIVSKIKKQL